MITSAQLFPFDPYPFSVQDDDDRGRRSGESHLIVSGWKRRIDSRSRYSRWIGATALASVLSACTEKSSGGSGGAGGGTDTGNNQLSLGLLPQYDSGVSRDRTTNSETIELDLKGNPGETGYLIATLQRGSAEDVLQREVVLDSEGKTTVLFAQVGSDSHLKDGIWNFSFRTSSTKTVNLQLTIDRRSEPAIPSFESEGTNEASPLVASHPSRLGVVFLKGEAGASVRTMLQTKDGVLLGSYPDVMLDSAGVAEVSLSSDILMRLNYNEELYLVTQSTDVAGNVGDSVRVDVLVADRPILSWAADSASGVTLDGRAAIVLTGTQGALAQITATNKEGGSQTVSGQIDNTGRTVVNLEGLTSGIWTLRVFDDPDPQNNELQLISHRTEPVVSVVIEQVGGREVVATLKARDLSLAGAFVSVSSGSETASVFLDAKAEGSLRMTLPDSHVMNVDLVITDRYGQQTLEQVQLERLEKPEATLMLSDATDSGIKGDGLTSSVLPVLSGIGEEQQEAVFQATSADGMSLTLMSGSSSSVENGFSLSLSDAAFESDGFWLIDSVGAGERAGGTFVGIDRTPPAAVRLDLDTADRARMDLSSLLKLRLTGEPFATVSLARDSADQEGDVSAVWANVRLDHQGLGEIVVPAGELRPGQDFVVVATTTDAAGNRTVSRSILGRVEPVALGSLVSMDAVSREGVVKAQAGTLRFLWRTDDATAGESVFLTATTDQERTLFWGVKVAGGWLFQVEIGRYQDAQKVQLDVDGASLTLIMDRSAPQTPVARFVQEVEGLDGRAVVFSGEPFARVQLTDPRTGDFWGQVTLDAQGRGEFSLIPVTPATALPEIFSFRAFDQAGNASAVGSLSLVEQGATEQLMLAAHADTGTLGDGVTGQRQISLRVLASATDLSDLSGSGVVLVRIDSDQGSDRVVKAIVTRSGEVLHIRLPDDAIREDGTITVRLPEHEQVLPLTFHVDTIAPALPQVLAVDQLGFRFARPDSDASLRVDGLDDVARLKVTVVDGSGDGAFVIGRSVSLTPSEGVEILKLIDLGIVLDWGQWVRLRFESFDKALNRSEAIHDISVVRRPELELSEDTSVVDGVTASDVVVLTIKAQPGASFTAVAQLDERLFARQSLVTDADGVVSWRIGSSDSPISPGSWTFGLELEPAGLDPVDTEGSSFEDTITLTVNRSLPVVRLVSDDSARLIINASAGGQSDAELWLASPGALESLRFEGAPKTRISLRSDDLGVWATARIGSDGSVRELQWVEGVGSWDYGDQDVWTVEAVSPHGVLNTFEIRAVFGPLPFDQLILTAPSNRGTQSDTVTSASSVVVRVRMEEKAAENWLVEIRAHRTGSIQTVLGETEGDVSTFVIPQSVVALDDRYTVTLFDGSQKMTMVDPLELTIDRSSPEVTLSWGLTATDDAIVMPVKSSGLSETSPMSREGWSVVDPQDLSGIYLTSQEQGRVKVALVDSLTGRSVVLGSRALGLGGSSSADSGTEGPFFLQFETSIREALELLNIPLSVRSLTLRVTATSLADVSNDVDIVVLSLEDVVLRPVRGQASSRDDIDVWIQGSPRATVSVTARLGDEQRNMVVRTDDNGRATVAFGSEQEPLLEGIWILSTRTGQSLSWKIDRSGLPTVISFAHGGNSASTPAQSRILELRGEPEASVQLFVLENGVRRALSTVILDASGFGRVDIEPIGYGQSLRITALTTDRLQNQHEGDPLDFTVAPLSIGRLVLDPLTDSGIVGDSITRTSEFRLLLKLPDDVLDDHVVLRIVTPESGIEPLDLVGVPSPDDPKLLTFSVGGADQDPVIEGRYTAYLLQAPEGLSSIDPLTIVIDRSPPADVTVRVQGENGLTTSVAPLSLVVRGEPFGSVVVRVADFQSRVDLDASGRGIIDVMEAPWLEQTRIEVTSYDRAGNRAQDQSFDVKQMTPPKIRIGDSQVAGDSVNRIADKTLLVDLTGQREQSVWLAAYHSELARPIVQRVELDSQGKARVQVGSSNHPLQEGQWRVFISDSSGIRDSDSGVVVQIDRTLLPISFQALTDRGLVFPSDDETLTLLEPEKLRGIVVRGEPEATVRLQRSEGGSLITIRTIQLDAQGRGLLDVSAEELGLTRLIARQDVSRTIILAITDRAGNAESQAIVVQSPQPLAQDDVRLSVVGARQDADAQDITNAESVIIEIRGQAADSLVVVATYLSQASDQASPELKLRAQIKLDSEGVGQVVFGSSVEPLQEGRWRVGLSDTTQNELEVVVDRTIRAASVSTLSQSEIDLGGLQELSVQGDPFDRVEARIVRSDGEDVKAWLPVTLNNTGSGVLSWAGVGDPPSPGSSIVVRVSTMDAAGNVAVEDLRVRIADTPTGTLILDPLFDSGDVGDNITSRSPFDLLLMVDGSPTVGSIALTIERNDDQNTRNTVSVPVSSSESGHLRISLTDDHISAQGRWMIGVASEQFGMIDPIVVVVDTTRPVGARIVVSQTEGLEAPLPGLIDLTVFAEQGSTVAVENATNGESWARVVLSEPDPERVGGAVARFHVNPKKALTFDTNYELRVITTDKADNQTIESHTLTIAQRVSLTIDPEDEHGRLGNEFVTMSDSVTLNLMGGSGAEVDLHVLTLDEIPIPNLDTRVRLDENGLGQAVFGRSEVPLDQGRYIFRLGDVDTDSNEGQEIVVRVDRTRPSIEVSISGQSSLLAQSPYEASMLTISTEAFSSIRVLRSREEQVLGQGRADADGLATVTLTPDSPPFAFNSQERLQVEAVDAAGNETRLTVIVRIDELSARVNVADPDDLMIVGNSLFTMAEDIGVQIQRAPIGATLTVRADRLDVAGSPGDLSLVRTVRINPEGQGYLSFGSRDQTALIDGIWRISLPQSVSSDGTFDLVVDRSVDLPQLSLPGLPIGDVLQIASPRTLQELTVHGEIGAQIQLYAVDRGADGDDLLLGSVSLPSRGLEGLSSASVSLRNLSLGVNAPTYGDRVDLRAVITDRAGNTRSGQVGTLRIEEKPLLQLDESSDSGEQGDQRTNDDVIVLQAFGTSGGEVVVLAYYRSDPDQDFGPRITEQRGFFDTTGQARLTFGRRAFPLSEGEWLFEIEGASARGQDVRVIVDRTLIPQTQIQIQGKSGLRIESPLDFVGITVRGEPMARVSVRQIDDQEQVIQHIGEATLDRVGYALIAVDPVALTPRWQFSQTYRLEIQTVDAAGNRLTRVESVTVGDLRESLTLSAQSDLGQESTDGLTSASVLIFEVVARPNAQDLRVLAIAQRDATTLASRAVLVDDQGFGRVELDASNWRDGPVTVSLFDGPPDTATVLSSLDLEIDRSLDAPTLRLLADVDLQAPSPASVKGFVVGGERGSEVELSRLDTAGRVLESYAMAVIGEQGFATIMIDPTELRWQFDRSYPLRVDLTDRAGNRTQADFVLTIDPLQVRLILDEDSDSGQIGDQITKQKQIQLNLYTPKDIEDARWFFGYEREPLVALGGRFSIAAESEQRLNLPGDQVLREGSYRVQLRNGFGGIEIETEFTVDRSLERPRLVLGGDTDLNAPRPDEVRAIEIRGEIGATVEVSLVHTGVLLGRVVLAEQSGEPHVGFGVLNINLPLDYGSVAELDVMITDRAGNTKQSQERLTIQGRQRDDLYLLADSDSGRLGDSVTSSVNILVTTDIMIDIKDIREAYATTLDQEMKVEASRIDLSGEGMLQILFAESSLGEGRWVVSVEADGYDLAPLDIEIDRTPPVVETTLILSGASAISPSIATPNQLYGGHITGEVGAMVTIMFGSDITLGPYTILDAQITRLMFDDLSQRIHYGESYRITLSTQDAAGNTLEQTVDTLMVEALQGQLQLLPAFDTGRKNNDEITRAETITLAAQLSSQVHVYGLEIWGRSGAHQFAADERDLWINLGSLMEPHFVTSVSSGFLRVDGVYSFLLSYRDAVIPDSDLQIQIDRTPPAFPQVEILGAVGDLLVSPLDFMGLTLITDPEALLSVKDASGYYVQRVSADENGKVEVSGTSDANPLGSDLVDLLDFGKTVSLDVTITDQAGNSSEHMLAINVDDIMVGFRLKDGEDTGNPNDFLSNKEKEITFIVDVPSLVEGVSVRILDSAGNAIRNHPIPSVLGGTVVSQVPLTRVLDDEPYSFVLRYNDQDIQSVDPITLRFDRRLDATMALLANTGTERAQRPSDFEGGVSLVGEPEASVVLMVNETLFPAIRLNAMGEGLLDISGEGPFMFDSSVVLRTETTDLAGNVRSDSTTLITAPLMAEILLVTPTVFEDMQHITNAQELEIRIETDESNLMGLALSIERIGSDKRVIPLEVLGDDGDVVVMIKAEDLLESGKYRLTLVLGDDPVRDVEVALLIDRDIRAPILTIADQDDLTVSQPSKLNGGILLSAEHGSMVSVSLEDSSGLRVDVLMDAELDAKGTVTVPFTLMAEYNAIYSAEVSLTDRAGNSRTDSYEITVDQIEAMLRLVSDTGVSNSDRITMADTLSFVITSVPNFSDLELIVYSADDKELERSTLDPTDSVGRVDFTLSEGSTRLDGVYRFELRYNDEAVKRQGALEVTVDREVDPLTVQLTRGEGLEAISLQQVRIGLTLTGEPESTVEAMIFGEGISDEGARIEGSLGADGMGRLDLQNVSVSFGEDYRLQFVVKDRAGNEKTFSETLMVVSPGDASLELLPSSDTGIVGDNITRVKSFRVVVNTMSGLDEVELRGIGPGGLSLPSRILQNTSGRDEILIDNAVITRDGEYNFSLFYRDFLLDEAKLQVVLDTLKPKETKITLSGSTSLTASAPSVVQGFDLRGESGVNVQLTLTDTKDQKILTKNVRLNAQEDDNPGFGVLGDLALVNALTYAQTYNIRLETSDVAGNMSYTNQELVILPPNVSVMLVSEDDSGQSQTDGITNERPWQLDVRGPAELEITAAVSTVSGSLVRREELTLDQNGKGSLYVTLDDIKSDGIYDVDLIYRDRTLSMQSIQINYDTTPAEVRLSFVASGGLEVDSVNDFRRGVELRSEPNARITLTLAGEALDPVMLSDQGEAQVRFDDFVNLVSAGNTYQLSVEAVDLAGNVGDSQSYNLTIKGAQSVVLSDPADSVHEEVETIGLSFDVFDEF